MKKYIVLLKEGFTRDNLLPFAEKIGKPKSMHDIVIVEATDEQIDVINSLDFVLLIEEDGYATPEVQTRPTDSWALERISSIGKVTKTNNFLYNYNRTGKDVNFFIIDSGVRNSHQDFNGKFETIYTEIEGQDYDVNNDLNTQTASRNHGTVCAAVAVGNIHGVAPEANCYNLFMDYSFTSVTKCYDTIIAKHKESNLPSVVNMSYSSKSVFFKIGVERMAREGILGFCAAGNDNTDLGKIAYYPANSDNVMTVGSLDKNDNRSSFSNYGKFIDIYAPGSGILTANILSDISRTVVSGTSLASPLCAGVACLLLEGSEKPENLEDLNKVFEIFKQQAIKQSNNKNVLYSLVNNEKFIKPKPVEPPVVEEPEQPIPPLPTPPRKKDDDDDDKKKKIIIGVFVAIVIGVIVNQTIF